jgi:hypothetical protein
MHRVVLLLVWIALPSVAVAGEGVEDWYENPLGFSPLALHTANGLILPAAAAALCWWLTDDDPAWTRRWSFHVESGVSWGYKPPYTTLSQSNVAALYHPRSWLAVGAELSVYAVRDAVNDTVGVGVRPVVRFTPLRSDRVSLFFEAGAGLMAFAEEFSRPHEADPRLGTILNGTPKYGVGAELRLTGRVSLLLGVRHVHVSNGNVRGVERNPSHDSNGFSLGLAVRP